MNNMQRTLKKLFVIFPPFIWLIMLLFIPFLIIAIISLSEHSMSIPPFKLFFYKDELTQSFHIHPYLENYKLLFADSFYIKAYFSSMKIAAIAMIIALFIGYPLALAIASRPEHHKNFLIMLIMLPFWTSLIIRVYAWNSVIGDMGIVNKALLHMHIIDSPIHILNSKVAVVIGIVYCYLPFMVMPIFNAIEKIDKSLIEASMDLGCNHFSSFYRVVLPLSIHGVMVGCMLTFIPAVGEFVIPDLLGGGQVLTIGKVIWDEFFYNRDWPVASAITVVITLVFVVPIAIIQRIITKKDQ